MNYTELAKSARAAVSAAGVVWGLYFSVAAIVTLVQGRNPTDLWVAARIFGVFGAVYLILLFLFLLPLLQWRRVQQLGAPFTAPAALLLSLVSIVVLSLYLADPGDGDPSTVAGVMAHWRARPLEFFVAFMPFWVSVAVFPLVRRRHGHS